MLVEDSSTKRRRPGSTPSKRPLKAALLRSSRSVAASVFFVGPPQLVADRPAHRRARNPNPPLLFPHLAVALQGGVVVFFELLPQSLLLLFGCKDASLSPRGGARKEVLALPP